MVHVAPGSWPPSWSQNEVKVLIDAEPSLYSSSVETPGPGETFSTTQVLRCHQPGWLDLPFFILPSDLFPLVCLSTTLILLTFKTVGLLCVTQPRAAASADGVPGAPARRSRRLA